jgi:hypothetical protein
MKKQDLDKSREQFMSTAYHRVRRTALKATRRLRPNDRGDVVATIVAMVWEDWLRVAERGRNPEELLGCIINCRIKHVFNGRRFNGVDGKGHFDVFDHNANMPSWQEFLTSERQYTPADAACFRIDFQEWMHRLPSRRQRMVNMLVDGHSAVVVAKTIGTSQGRVSQERSQLADDWNEYQSE